MISVIVPVYNVENYLTECVESVLRQTYRDFELILVDDGSTDSSGGMCDEFAAADPRVRVIHTANGGLSHARNVGLDAARGEYISFVDSDDIIHPAFLKTLYENISGYMMCFCDHMAFNSEPPLVREDFKYHLSTISGSVRMRDASPQVVSACTKLYKRSLFDGFRFQEGLLYEDRMSFYLLFYLAQTVVYIDAPLYFYRYNPLSITNNPKNKLFSYECFVLAACGQCEFYTTTVNDKDSLLFAFREGRGSWLHYVAIAGYDQKAKSLHKKLKTIWRKHIALRNRTFGEWFLFMLPKLYACRYRRIAAKRH